VFSEYLTVADALFITIVSISIVFAILFLIQLCISSFKYIFKEDIKQDGNKAVKAENKSLKGNERNAEISNNQEELAALTFALIHCNENNGKKFVVTKLREIKQGD
jgi:Na+-transporting methylmalonyl-CoA/oxaloacetate decarboxylase gamma subunit